MNCFSGTIRPALTMVRESSGDRGCGAIGSGLGITSSSGAVAPSSAPSQDAVDSVSSATAAARGAKASSGSIPPTRSADERCSWWTTATSRPTSMIAAAIRAGVTVTRTSTSRSGSAASSPTSVSAENWASQRFGTSRDGARWRGSSPRTSTRCSTVTAGSIA